MYIRYMNTATTYYPIATVYQLSGSVAFTIRSAAGVNTVIGFVSPVGVNTYRTRRKFQIRETGTSADGKTYSVRKRAVEVAKEALEAARGAK